MRVLHLIDLRHDGVEPMLACRHAASIPGVAHHTIALGSSRDARVASALGLAIDDLLAPLAGPAELSARRLRRLIASRLPAGTSSRPDIVQCWSAPVLGLGRLACGGGAVRVGALLRAPRSAPDSLVRDLRARAALLDATLFCFDRHTRRAWAPAASALRGGRYGEQDIRLLPPPAFTALGARQPRTRAAIRARLGAADDQVVIALLADPSRGAASQRFAFTLGLLYTTGARVFGVVPPGASNLARAKRFVRLHGKGWGFDRADAPLPTVLHACDIAVWDCPASRPACGSTLLTAAMGAGLPIVASRHDIATETLGRATPDLVARDDSANAIADRLLTLVGDPARRAAIGARARAAAADHAAAFPERLVQLWNEAANVPVPVPGLPQPLALAGRPA
ncbi:MAG: hypothetical protein IT438_08735 [Phycisphaerales bacterium]|nr:hypothetical protein [Phycisphaerales bacterium]